MSDTTQPRVEQWIVAAIEIKQLLVERQLIVGMYDSVLEDIAAIIARHAPKEPEGVAEKRHRELIKLIHTESWDRKCAHCGKTATCMGAYESEDNLGFACDECCGHGNEDGWCVPLDGIVMSCGHNDQYGYSDDGGKHIICLLCEHEKQPPAAKEPSAARGDVKPKEKANMPKSVVQDWVSELGLRHQGVLMTVIRGCDTAPKHDPSKLLSRCIREVILNAFVGDPAKAATFIEKCHTDEILTRMRNFRKNLDHYPHHYVMHLTHAAEVIGYKHPEPIIASLWLNFYKDLCHGLHVNPETEPQMDARLLADEIKFAEMDKR